MVLSQYNWILQMYLIFALHEIILKLDEKKKTKGKRINIVPCLCRLVDVVADLF